MKIIKKQEVVEPNEH